MKALRLFLATAFAALLFGGAPALQACRSLESAAPCKMGCGTKDANCCCKVDQSNSSAPVKPAQTVAPVVFKTAAPEFGFYNFSVRVLSSRFHAIERASDPALRGGLAFLGLLLI
jgi:hypothetical protein